MSALYRAGGFLAVAAGSECLYTKRFQADEGSQIATVFGLRIIRGDEVR
jgi:hypothetical protein